MDPGVPLAHLEDPKALDLNTVGLSLVPGKHTDVPAIEPSETSATRLREYDPSNPRSPRRRGERRGRSGAYVHRNDCDSLTWPPHCVSAKLDRPNTHQSYLIPYMQGHISLHNDIPFWQRHGLAVLYT